MKDSFIILNEEIPDYLDSASYDEEKDNLKTKNSVRYINSSCIS